MLSVLLQLAGFFTLAQTVGPSFDYNISLLKIMQILWISKISFGSIGKLADHFQIYFAALVVTAVVSASELHLSVTLIKKTI